MKKNINNKGFTLVELLAVMVILISISLVAVGGISASLERRDEKECEEQVELAIGAAKIYFSLNSGTTTVTIKKLNGEIDPSNDEDYFKDDKKIDRLDKNASITLEDNKYVYSGSCS